MIKQAQNLAFSSTPAQLCADVLTTERNGVHTNCYDATWSWMAALSLWNRNDPEVQWGQKSLLAAFMEEPAFPIKLRVEKNTLTAIDIWYRSKIMCFTNINLAAENRTVWLRRVYKVGRPAKCVLQWPAPNVIKIKELENGGRWGR